METNWTLSVWGVRGSGPMAVPGYLEYGGNTACTAVDCGGTLVVFDAGSGLTPLGSELLRRGIKRVHLLISHLHLDHLLGLATFPLLMEPEAEIHLYGEGWGGVSLQERLDALLGDPYWPVGLAQLPAKLHLHELGPDQRFRLDGGAGGPEVSTLRGAHPGGSLLYRLDGGGHSVIHGLDCEMAGDMEPRLARFAQGGDLLIWDANFTPEDLQAGWGHSTWQQGLALGRAAGVRRVLMTHFNQRYTDSFLREQEAQARRADPACLFAKEGMELTL